METRSFGGVDVHMFLPLEEIEHGALQQIITTSKHPHVVDAVAVMPDCHQGYGVAIGTILATEGVIIPNAVGVDIGCGVGWGYIPQQYDPQTMDETFWKTFDSHVRRLIPLGRDAHTKEQLWYGFDDFDYTSIPNPQRVALQLGTLGGGNHFLEVAVDAKNTMYFLVHSGSRGFGHSTATKHQAIAEAINAKKSIKRDPQSLESLSMDSKEGQAYYDDMWKAELYAADSRKRMFYSLVTAFGETMDQVLHQSAFRQFVAWSDIPHNYARFDSKNNTVIHRKGAIYAGEQVRGIIPGSMGSSTYIVEGLGNPNSLYSASHGAGRTMSRNAAKKTFDMDAFQESMVGTYSYIDSSILDESPLAYKNVDDVINRQLDCVRVVNKLRPIISIKGGGKGDD